MCRPRLFRPKRARLFREPFAVEANDLQDFVSVSQSETSLSVEDSASESPLVSASEVEQDSFSESSAEQEGEIALQEENGETQSSLVQTEEEESVYSPTASKRIRQESTFSITSLLEEEEEASDNRTDNENDDFDHDDGGYTHLVDETNAQFFFYS